MNIHRGQLWLEFGYNVPWSEYRLTSGETYVHVSCTNCTLGGATKYKPDDWPDTNDYPYPNINEK